MAITITDRAKLNAGMSATADRIRAKAGTSTPIAWDYDGGTGFKAAVEAIQTGSQAVIEPIIITENGVYAVPSGVDGYAPVTVGVTGRSPRCDQTVTFDWAEEQTHMAWMEGSPEPEPPTPPTPPTPVDSTWTTGTDAQVAAILDAAALGTIDLQHDAGWRVGDKRTIHVDAFTSGSGTTHAAQDVHIVITSFDDYNGCGNLMQFDFVECVMQERINDTASASGNYGNTEMYTTTLPALVAALPTWLKTRLKSFDVLSAEIAAPWTIDTVSGNKLALRAEYEIAGSYNPYETITRPNPDEGAQLPYYAVAENRKKESSYWTRTVYLNATTPPETRFWFIESLGNPAGGHIVNTADGVAPFGCLGGAPFATASDNEIAALLDAAAAGTIDLQQDAGWAVGDMRLVNVGAFAGYNSNNHSAEQLHIVITSFAEYGNCGNVVQIDFAECLGNLYPWTHGGGYYAQSYGYTQIFHYTLPGMFWALPDWMKTRLKIFSVPVNKMVYEDGAYVKSLETVAYNLLVLRSGVEIFGNIAGVEQNEGTQLPYYQNADNRIKKQGASGNAVSWWERSLFDETGLAYVDASGDNSTSAGASGVNKGIAPFGCLGGVSSFTSGSDADVAALIDAAQAGTVDLQEDAGWHVGDMRLIHLNAWTGGDNVAHAAEDLFIVISSFEEYNNCGNVLQFDFANCCAVKQRMNPTNTTEGGYGATEMYTATLPALVTALPSWLRTRLRIFSVLASAGGSNLSTIETVPNNKLALRAIHEIFEPVGHDHALSGEGVRAEYYISATRTTKTIGKNGYNSAWWTRSADIYDSTKFCRAQDSYESWANASLVQGVAPFGCL